MDKKKIKKRKVVSSIILGIALATVFPFAWNAGMLLPWGYKRDSGVANGRLRAEAAHPFYSYDKRGNPGKYSTNYDCYEETWFHPYNKDGRFDYKGEIYYVRGSSTGYNVYQETDNSLVGQFNYKERDGLYKCEQKYTFIFFDDNYIYNLSIRRISRFYFAIPTHLPLEENYKKYEFYRFNLDDGKNEKIKPELFVEKINKYDDTIKLK